MQAGSTFSATPPSVTMNEGTTTTLSGQAGGAQKVYWSLVKNGVETVLATDQFTYTVSPGRVTGNQSFVIRFKGIYPTGQPDGGHSRHGYRHHSGPGVHANGPRHLGWPPDDHDHAEYLQSGAPCRQPAWPI